MSVQTSVTDSVSPMGMSVSESAGFKPGNLAKCEGYVGLGSLCEGMTAICWAGVSTLTLVTGRW